MRTVTHHRRGTPLGDRRRERGTVMIEAAIAVPIFFVLVFGLVDIGLLVLQKSQATNAAVDGARIGLIRWDQADVTGSEDRLAIEDAVRDRLPGQKVDAVTVRCINPSSTTITCASAGEKDRIEVKVKWTWKPLSPAGYAIPSRDVTGSSTMAIIPRPCVPSDVAADNPDFPVCPEPDLATPSL